LHQVAWQRELFRIAVILSAGLAAGMSFGFPLWGLLAGLVVSQVIMLRSLGALYRWSHKAGPAPQDNGLVGYSADTMFRRERDLNRTIKIQRRQLKRISQGIESLQDGVLIIDGSGYITTFNRAVCHLLGLRTESDMGQHITNLIRAPKFTKYFDKGDYSQPLEFDAPHKSNMVVQAQITGFGLDQKVIIVRDVTERQRVETMRQNFIADVSHELRTPLTVISGYLEMMQDLDLPSPVARAVGQMHGQSGRMRSLVDDLLHLSKLESDSEMNHQWFSLFPLCSAVVDQLRAYAPAGDENLTAKIALHCERDISLLGSEDELNSVLTNLITNAIKYGRKLDQSAIIDVRVTRVNNGLEISVSDKGPGIPAQHLANLTERFYRVDDSRESTLGGSGLGLSIVKFALDHHGAELRIQSSPLGSRFSFVIPSERVQ